MKIHLASNSQSHWIDLGPHNKETFQKEVSRLFGSEKVWREWAEGIPFEFIHAGTENRSILITERFWDWKNYSPEDQKLLLQFMEISQDDESTLEEAKKYFEENKACDFLKIL